MFSEILYDLRKKSGLSQEQLAEKLDVSRQSVSKWESGISMPETEKLIAISEFFGVSLDALIGKEPQAKEKEPLPAKDTKTIAGLAIAALGILGLVLWGIITIFAPDASDKLSASSAVTIDGSGIFLIASVLAVGLGAWLLLKQKRP